MTVNMWVQNKTRQQMQGQVARQTRGNRATAAAEDASATAEVDAPTTESATVEEVTEENEPPAPRSSSELRERKKK